jgi:hypothetical protein
MTSTVAYPVKDSADVQRVSIGAGTAIKIGFFGALGAFLFGLIIWTIFAVLAIAFGLLGYLTTLKGQF